MPIIKILITFSLGIIILKTVDELIKFSNELIMK